MAEYAFDTPGPVQLYVENGSGTVNVTASDVTTTTVDITGRHADDVEVIHRASGVSVIAPKHRLTGRDQELGMQITVPSDSTLTSKTGSADVTATGSLGAANVKTGSGDLLLERLVGPGVIDTGSGDVTISDASGELRIRSGSGDVAVEESSAPASISTGSGDVRVRHAAGELVVKTGSGDLEIIDAESDVRMSTGSGATTIRSARRGRVTSKGASGDVRIGIPAGTPVWTDIHTVSGRVGSRLDSVGEPEAGEDYVEVRATTVSGDVLLLPA